MSLVNFNSDKDNSLCVIRNIERASFFAVLLLASCLKYNKLFRLIYCNSIVTIDKDGKIHISMSNIDADNAQEVTINLPDVKAKKAVGEILTSANLTDCNSFENPIM